MDGKSFFYVNPLEVYPKNHTNPVLELVKVERQNWYPCACCPPNVARFLLNIGDYIYSTDDDTLYIHQYIANNSKFGINDKVVEISMDCNLLQSQNIKIRLNSSSLSNTKLALRVPSWSDAVFIKINDDTVSEYDIVDGYIYLNNILDENVNIEISFDTTLKLVKSSSKVRYNSGKVAVTYGPVVYCAEEVDNGEMLYDLVVSKSKEFRKENFEYNGLELSKILISGYREIDNDDNLYHVYNTDLKEQEIKLVPYHFWGNRGIGEMQVWLRVR